jgi:AraC-like DNA-binding protein
MLYEQNGGCWLSLLYIPECSGGPWEAQWQAQYQRGDAARPAPGLFLATIGRFFSSGGFNYEQVSPHVAVHVIQSGHGVVQVGGIEYQVGQGDVFAFFPGLYYRYSDRPQTPWRYTWCVLSGEDAPSALRLTGITPESPRLHGDFARTLEPLFAQVEETYVSPETPRVFPTAAAWSMIDLLTRSKRDGPATQERNIADLARSLIDHRFMTGLSVVDIARHLNVDRSTLFRKFRDRFRVSPKEYLDSVRLDHARQLLRRSQSTVKEVATVCGFEDVHYFSRAYRKKFGYPPSIERMTSDRLT